VVDADETSTLECVRRLSVALFWVRSFTGTSITLSVMSSVTVFGEEGNCIVCLEMRADELIRHLISGELANYRVVRTSPKPLHLPLPKLSN
jgi:hypothetical protein